MESEIPGLVESSATNKGIEPSSGRDTLLTVRPIRPDSIVPPPLLQPVDHRLAASIAAGFSARFNGGEKERAFSIRYRGSGVIGTMNPGGKSLGEIYRSRGE